MLKRERYIPGGGMLYHPLFLREVKRYEGLNPEDLLGKEKGPAFLVYLCAPLQETTRKSVFQHLAEAAVAASLIEGAIYEGKRVATFIPHVVVTSIFNELEIPQRREAAMGLNIACLEQCHALIKRGTRISASMRDEIIAARELGLPVFSFPAFKRRLINLPSSTEARETFVKIIKSLPPEIFTERLVDLKPT